MRHIDAAERARSWVVDYSVARARAVAWLGDRYLLARPVNRRLTPNGLGHHEPPNPASH